MEETREGKREYRTAIVYVVFLTLMIPAVILYSAVSVFIAELIGYGGWILPLFGILALLYFIVLLVFAAKNIGSAVAAGGRQDVQTCVNGMLIHKYGLVVFFLINFAALFFLYLIFLVASRGTFFVFLPIAVPISMATTWITMIPGAIYGLQVARLSRRAGKLSNKACLWHSLLQFVFFLDVLSAMYLAVKKWNVGKKSSAVILVLYLIGLALAAYVICGIAIHVKG